MSYAVEIPLGLVQNNIDVEKRENSRNPNHSIHTVGSRPDTLPWAKPSRALATHRFEISEIIATAT